MSGVPQDALEADPSKSKELATFVSIRSIVDRVVRAMEEPARYWADPAEGARDLVSGMIRHGVSRLEGNLRRHRRAIRDRAILETQGARSDAARRIRDSKRFRIDAEFLRHVEDSPYLNDADRLVEALPLARLPFPSVWLEYEKQDSEDRSMTGSGLLIERIDPEDPTAWIMSHFVLREDGLVHVVPFRNAMSCDGEPFRFPDEVVAYGQGYRGIQDHMLWSGLAIGRRAEGKLRFAVPRSYENAVTLVVQPLYEAAFGRHMDAVRSKRQFPGESGMMKKAIMEARGDLRYAVALLATINHLPYEIVPSEELRRSPDAGSLPTSLIRLVAGSERREGVDPLTHAIERCLHDVRGHFRRYRDEEGNVVRSVWVREHQRGSGDKKLAQSYSVGVVTNEDEAAVPTARPNTEAALPASGTWNRLRAWVRNVGRQSWRSS